MMQAADGRKRAPASPKGGAKRRRKKPTKADERVAEGKPTGAQVVLEKAELFKALYRDWRRGISTSTLAERYNMTPRRVQQLIDEMRAASVEAMAVTSPLAGLKITDELMVHLHEAIGQAAELTELAIEDRNLSVALGALKRTADARRELLELQQDRGIVPRKIGLLAAQQNALQLLDRILEVFAEFEVPDEAGIRIADLMEMDTRKVGGRLELDLGGEEVVDAQVGA